ncbi:S49 family peptidase [Bradyrhizobium prioriisuperbiae]|uniref:S49 family peptidase n=1 Tax=Bradyrhizobium prioriisuperbiae TaxID=2854389 RepID=UPI0028F1641B|nr:S49 family peptidase [Bradyrhizobium prioritasuperba]
MKYMNILLECAAEPWALEKTKLVSIANFLRFKASGGQYSAEEVAKITQKREREAQRTEGSIGILPIHGVIGERMNLIDDFSGGTSSELITKQFRSMLNDSACKAIILDVNSPGGVARSVEEVGNEIYAARGIKPIVAQINTCAASAAYWIAAQAEEVVVTPSGQAGSIGVYTIHEDVSEMLAKEGIKETLIYSGEYKVMGNSFEPLGAEAKSIMQQRVDELASSFVRSVARGRGVSLKEVNDRFGQGQMFGAAELVDRGMADKVAPMSETLERFGVNVNPALSRAKAMGGDPVQYASDDALKLRRLQDWGRSIGDNDLPPPSEFEAILRDAGVSKTQRARIASRMHAVLRSESGENEAETAVANALAELRQRVDSFTIPKI